MLSANPECKLVRTKKIILDFRREIYARHAQGISQEHLARRLSVDPNTLAKWERGSGDRRRLKDFFETSSPTEHQ